MIALIGDTLACDHDVRGSLLSLLQVFVSSGLGGMSGAQPKAATIVGCIGVIAEVNAAALLKRHQQG